MTGNHGVIVDRTHAFKAKVPREQINELGGRTRLTVRVFGHHGDEFVVGSGEGVLADSASAGKAWDLTQRFGSAIAGAQLTASEASAKLDNLMTTTGSDDQDAALGSAVNAIRTALRALTAQGDEGGATEQNPERGGAITDYRHMFGRITEAGWWPEVSPPQVGGRSPNSYGRHNARNLGGTSIESHFVERAALTCGLETFRHSKEHLTVIDPNGKAAAFYLTGSPATGHTGHAIARDKEATRYLLRQGGVPAPVGRSFPPDAVEHALDYAESIGFPVAVKPLAGRAGIGVFTNVTTREQAARAIERIRQSQFGKGPFILEEHIRGDAYRVFVAGDHVYSIVRYEHGTISGDGSLTVGELLLQKDIIRWPNPHLSRRRIQLDDAVMQRLTDEELTLDTVLESGRRAIFTPNPNFNQGGESIEVLDETHPSILEAAVRATRLVPGISFTGLDFIIPDHTAPLDGQGAAICEINAHPVLGSGVFPLYGPSRDTPEELIRHVAEQQGLQLADTPADDLSVQVTVSGNVQGVFFRRWMKKRASTAGLTGWVRNTTNEKVQAVVAGPRDAVAALVSAAAVGPKRAKPLIVRTTHVPLPESAHGFRVRKTADEVP